MVEVEEDHLNVEILSKEIGYPAFCQSVLIQLGAGSVSNSGLLFAKLDYFKHLEIFAKALDATKAGRNAAITEALTAVETLVGDGNSWEDLGSMFQLCGPLDRTNALTSEATIEIQLMSPNVSAFVLSRGTLGWSSSKDQGSVTLCLSFMTWSVSL